VSFFTVSVQRELGYQQKPASDLRKIKIRLAVAVFEDTQTDHLGNQLVGYSFIIALTDADKHRKTLADTAFGLPVNVDFSRSDALYYESH
jgi:hypothetical protein